MAINFPNSPTNGQTVTVDGVTYSWNAAGSVWDIVTTATATVAVTAPVTNTGTSTAAVLGIQANPTFGNQVNVTNATALGTPAGSQVNLLKLTANSGNGDQLEITNTRTVGGSFWNSGGYRIQQKIDATWMGYIQFNGNNDTGVAIGTGASTGSPLAPTERLRVNGGGHITMPAQPTFYANGPAITANNQTVVNWATTQVNIGSGFNSTTGVYTAPVAGTYMITWDTIGNLTNDVYRFYLQKNGSTLFDFQVRADTNATGAEYSSTSSRTVFLNLAANDYINLRFTSDGGNIALNGNNQYVSFGARLLG
jgi:hypothetical protein